MHDNKFGKKFKNLRKQKHISLDMAAHDITSKSSLYYWEIGKANMSFEKVIAMLERMQIKPSEFVTDSLTDNFDYKKIVSAYNGNDDSELKRLSLLYLDASRRKPFDKTLLIRAAIACSCLNSDTRINLFSKQDTNRLIELLSETQAWHYADIFNFANTLYVLPGNRVYGLSKLIIAQFNNKTNDYQWQHAAITALTNAAFSLLFNDFQDAKKLIAEISNLNLGNNFAYEKIRLKFIKELKRYIITKDDRIIEQVFFPALKFFELDQLRLAFEKTFDQIRKIYDYH